MDRKQGMEAWELGKAGKLGKLGWPDLCYFSSFWTRGGKELVGWGGGKLAR